MGRVLTNATSLAVTTELTPGVLPGGTPLWFLNEPNTIGKFGPMLKKIAREPISKNRQRRKGALVDLDSSVEFECDITIDHVKMYMEGLFFATAKGGLVFRPTAVTATGFTVASGGAIADGTLFFVRGCTIVSNNGLKIANGTSTGTEIKCTGCTAETGLAARNVQLEICGVQLGAGDADVDSSGNITTTTFNWATGSSLQPGQFIWVGGDIDTPLLNFTTAANRGLVQLSVAPTATKLTTKKRSTTWVVEANTLSTLQVFWGQYIRNVAVDHTDYLERTFQFELAYENLGVTPGTDEYEYAIGNFVNEVVFDFPTTSKGTMKCSFIGMDTQTPSTARATGASAPMPPVATAPVNTTADMIRLRVTEIDEDGITTDFKSITVSIKNNVSGEKVLAYLGSKYMNAGIFDVEINASCLFTSSGVLAAMRNNTTLTMEVAIRNDDGGFVIDVPAMTVEGGDKEFPINQTVLITMKSMAFQDPTLGCSAALSTFAYLPAE